MVGDLQAIKVFLERTMNKSTDKIDACVEPREEIFLLLPHNGRGTIERGRQVQYYDSDTRDCPQELFTRYRQ